MRPKRKLKKCQYFLTPQLCVYFSKLFKYIFSFGACDGEFYDVTKRSIGHTALKIHLNVYLRGRTRVI